MPLRDFTEKVFILKRIPYKESSYILQAFSYNFGKISILAQGVRKHTNRAYGLLDLLNELEVVLYKKQSSDWYVLKSASILSSYLYNVSYRQSKYLYAASEIILQLDFHNEDSGKIYKLVLDYIKYQKKLDKNNIAIFWRFLLRLFDIMGIALNLRYCVICNSTDNKITAYSPIKKGVICKTCHQLPVYKSQTIKLDENAIKIIPILHEIGNYLDKITIDKDSGITKMLLLHLQEHFEKRFILKSLDM